MLVTDSSCIYQSQNTKAKLPQNPPRALRITGTTGTWITRMHTHATDTWLTHQHAREGGFRDTELHLGPMISRWSASSYHTFAISPEFKGKKRKRIFIHVNKFQEKSLVGVTFRNVVCSPTSTIDTAFVCVFVMLNLDSSLYIFTLEVKLDVSRHWDILEAIFISLDQFLLNSQLFCHMGSKQYTSVTPDRTLTARNISPEVQTTT